MKKVKVAVNGYGVIGKRVADAVRQQEDMELIGVTDVVTNYRIKTAAVGGRPVGRRPYGERERSLLHVPGIQPGDRRPRDNRCHAGPDGSGATGAALDSEDRSGPGDVERISEEQRTATDGVSRSEGELGDE